MKIIHTGDWHIGKLVHNVSMIKDQRVILNELLMLIDEEKPDVLLIAGDLYDRGIPSTEAVTLLDDVLSTIIMKYKTKIIMIAGNHDSSDRVSFGSKLLCANGLYINGNLEEYITPITLEDKDGLIDFYAIPFTEPVIVRELYHDETIKNHDDAMKAIISRINEKIDYSRRNICIAHAFVLGDSEPKLSDSERPLSIGGSSSVSSKYFEQFDYVALGHLHRQQKVTYDHVRYSGSLLKYSFSEVKQKKSVTIFDIDENGQISYELRVLKRSRDMRDLNGTLEQLLSEEIVSKGNTEDYIRAILTDEGELIDPIGKLRAVYPNILKLERASFERETGENKTSAQAGFAKKQPVELFKEFYENVSGKIFNDDKNNIVSKVVGELEKERREHK